jgi:hypothetical protein
VSAPTAAPAATSTGRRLDELVDSLLAEGYALYPYTPESTKNSTPTPFGIVYPPDYAANQPAAFDHLQVECVLVAPPAARVEATLRYLVASGQRHEAAERRLELPAATLDALAGDGVTAELDGDPVGGRVRLTARPLAARADGQDGENSGENGGETLWRLRLRVDNTTPPETPGEPGGRPGLDRGSALRRSLLSTHAVLRVSAGRFVSPLERDGAPGAAVAGCANVNTWPVLASPDDDAVVAAAIVLPDHPRIAPESRGDLFDGTEIEEALLLHVHALSDAERRAIEAQDPWVREMIARAASTTPEDVMALHGEFRPVAAGESAARPPAASAAGRAPDVDNNPGEESVEVDGVVLRRGGSVVLRPGSRGNPHDAMLDGRRATVERIYLDTDDRVYLGVTVDDDPGRDLMRQTGRYLFFFPPEVEVVE